MKSCVAALLLCSLYASADAVEVREEKTVGIYMSDFSYEEHILNEAGDAREFFMSTDGNMLGIFARYARYGTYMFKLEETYEKGKLNYVSNGTGTLKDDPFYTLEARAILGKPWAQKGDFSFTPYVGMGYFYLNNDGAGTVTSTGATGYERQQEYTYSPIGVEIMGTQLAHGWEMSGSLEYDYLWDGTNHTYVTLPPLKFNQSHGYGYRASVRFKKAQGKKTMVIEPFYTYWSIDDSSFVHVFNQEGEYQTSYQEPKNKTTEFGVKIGWVF